MEKTVEGFGKFYSLYISLTDLTCFKINHEIMKNFEHHSRIDDVNGVRQGEMSIDNVNEKSTQIYSSSISELKE